MDIGGGLRQILNRSKVTPTHLFKQIEESKRVKEIQKRKQTSLRSYSSSLINKKKDLMEKRSFVADEAGTIQNYGGGYNFDMGRLNMFQQKKSFDLGSHRKVLSHERFPENPNNLSDI